MSFLIQNLYIYLQLHLSLGRLLLIHVLVLILRQLPSDLIAPQVSCFLSLIGEGGPLELLEGGQAARLSFFFLHFTCDWV